MIISSCLLISLFRLDLFYCKTDKARLDYQDGMLHIMMRKEKRLK
jgi:hypothetical protein